MQNMDKKCTSTELGLGDKSLLGVLILIVIVLITPFIAKYFSYVYLPDALKGDSWEYVRFLTSIHDFWSKLLLGSVALFGVHLAVRKLEVSQQELNISKQNFEHLQKQFEEEKLAEHAAQISERFSRAIQQVSNKESLVVRVGGIYSLESVANDSKEVSWHIYKLLVTYLRQLIATTTKTSPEVQLILDILGRRSDRYVGQGIGDYINLSDLNLSGYKLKGDFSYISFKCCGMDNCEFSGKFSYANFSQANMCKITFKTQDALEVNFQNCNLTEAVFDVSFCESCYFNDGDLRQVSFKGANLKGSDMSGTNSINSDLRNANLQGVNFKKSVFDGADFRRAKNITKSQINKMKSHEGAFFPSNIEEI